MPTLPDKAAINRFKQYKVYPGQPLVLALITMKLYPSAKEAFATTTYGWPEAVGNNEIPGSGDMVYSALDVLRHYHKHKDPTLTLEYAYHRWERSVGPGTGNHEKSYLEGVHNSHLLDGEFLSALETWNWTDLPTS